MGFSLKSEKSLKISKLVRIAEINSDKAQKSLSGQQVSGSVTLHNEKARNIRALLLFVEGYCETSWSEGSGKSKTTYSAREDYMNTKTILLGNEADQQELPEGFHTFNFAFMLPLTIPSSFSSYHGKVQYQIRVVMDRQLKFNYNFKFPITVLTLLDLNFEASELRKPFIAGATKKFFLGFGSNPLHLRAKIPFCGYVMGQTLKIEVKIINESSVDVEQVEVELQRVCLYKCDYYNSKTEYQELHRVVNEGVISGESKEMNFILIIPNVEPTSDKFSKYVFLNYEVAVIAKVKGAHRSPSVKLPITIGNVALNGFDVASASSGYLTAPPSYDSVMNMDNEKVKI